VKLSDIQIVKRPLKVVPLRVPGSTEQFEVGFRLGTPTEHASVYRRAKAAATERGAESWDIDDPICSLELYVETVAAFAVSVENGKSDFDPWATADQIRGSVAVGQENLAYLYNAYQAFESEQSTPIGKLEPFELVKFCLEAAGDDTSFLDRLRPGTLRTYVRFLAAQYIVSIREKSQSSSGFDSSSTPSNTAGENS